MTKKDYELIAKVLGNKYKQVQAWRNGNIEAECLTLAYLEDFVLAFEQNNPKFNRSKFLKACGLEA